MKIGYSFALSFVGALLLLGLSQAGTLHGDDGSSSPSLSLDEYTRLTDDDRKALEKVKNQ
jgi:hypothetical protein